ncbi:hypothetical protein PVAP13_5KG299707 [Panicum virgatum]|uniref:Uncharacterized protein n=1 Tax=Panicum virgatum TaxID=38727 RepID=A0A8T0SM81_PANVG|nr:hypothetical protein PVAP13_5KG299707 [Panicum virgatum]
MECMNSQLLQLTETQQRNHQVRTWMKQVVGLSCDCGGNVELYIHYIAARIQELKVRARDVGYRRQRYGVTPAGAEEEDIRKRDELLFGVPPDTIKKATEKVLRQLPLDTVEEDARFRVTWLNITRDDAEGRAAVARNVYEHRSVMFLHLLYIYPDRSAWELIILLKGLQRNRNNIAKTMLTFYYNELPINHKSCLLYLSILPQDHRIRRTSLLRRWIAEGQEKGSKSLVDQAERVFNALVTRGFVRPGETSTSSKIKSCTIHHIVHEFITTDISLVDTCLPPELAHRLSMNSGMALQDASSSDQPFDVTGTLLQSMPELHQWKLLKVLDLEGCTGLKQKHMKNICKILLLKYLSLRKTSITKVFSTKSVTLPMLKYFLAGNKVSPPDNSPDRFQESFMTVHLPSGVRRMKKLEVLSHVEVSNNSSDDDLTDIGELRELRKLGVVLHGKKGGMSLLFKQIEKLHCLRSLSVRINQLIKIEKNAPDSDAVVPTLDAPPKLLESLNISGITFKSGLPQWIADLDHLSKITLQNTFLGEDAVHVLGKLRMLRCLRLLHKSYTESKLQFRADEFQRLRFLVVEGSDITGIIFDTGAAPKLEMMIWSFAALEALSLSGVENLYRLKKLELNGDCYMDSVREGIRHRPGQPNQIKISRRQQEDGTATAGLILAISS